MKNIALVGFMGTGKTTIAVLLADKLNIDYVDIDARIEAAECMAIADIFAAKGEQYFRRMEKDIVAQVSLLENKVIACGGGVVLDEENIKNLRKNGKIICLQASPEVILKRTKDYKHRPLLNVESPELRIRDLLEERKHYYAKADYIVDTSKLSVQEVTAKILSWLEGH